MKKLILLAVLLFIPLLADGQQMDALLTPDGTLYTVQFELASDHPEVQTQSSAYLTLVGRRGDEVTREIIPATTIDRGSNYNAALTYDTQSGILSVFWIHNDSMLSNQLMFTSREADGSWAQATSFGAWGDHRKNLRLAVTRRYEDEGGILHSGLSVHLTWWELNTTTGRESAKYAMVSLNGGRVVEIVPLDLAEFIPADLPQAENVNKDVLNQPVLFVSPTQEYVTLLFGDLDSGTLQQIRISPRKIVSDGRLRVPGGRREGGFTAPAMNLQSGDRLEGVYGDSKRFALYSASSGKLQYVVQDSGTWSEQHAISLDAQISSGAAVDALRRLVSEH